MDGLWFLILYVKMLQKINNLENSAFGIGTNTNFYTALNFQKILQNLQLFHTLLLMINSPKQMPYQSYS